MADTLTVVDNRTGKKYELPIEDGTIKAMDLRQIKASDDDFGLMPQTPERVRPWSLYTAFRTTAPSGAIRSRP